MNKLKILNIFNHHLEVGGESHAVESIVTSLDEICDVERCDFSSSDWIGSDAPAAWKQALWMFHNPSSIDILRRKHERFQPDVWLAHNVFPVGSAGVYSLARKLRVPLVQYIHNFRPFSVNGYLWADNRIVTGGLHKNYWSEVQHGAWRNSRIKTAWFALMLLFMHSAGRWRNVNAWVAISDFMRDKFVGAGIPAEDIFTLRHFWRPKMRLGETQRSHYLFLGRLTEAKGVFVLLNAWKILRDRYGSKAPQLVIAGDGPLRAAVTSHAKKMGHVRVVGHLSQELKSRALRGARGVLVPSLWWEPLGLVVYEAYDACAPVFAARSGGLTEIVLNGKTGLLHEPRNSQQLADQVMQLEQDEHLRRKLGEAGRQWLEQNADESRWQQQFLKIVEHIINRQRARGGAVPAT